MKFAIGIDLGGTRIKGIAVDAEGNTLHKLYMLTNDSDGAVWKKAVAETVDAGLIPALGFSALERLALTEERKQLGGGTTFRPEKLAEQLRCFSE